MADRWCDMSKREKLALLAENLNPQERAQIMARVEKHFRGRSMDDPNDALNVVLRESWRAQHGNTEEWDRAALAAGVIVR